MTNEEISVKADYIICKLYGAAKISYREREVLLSCLGRLEVEKQKAKTTERWAQEAFDENKRLVALISERWPKEEAYESAKK